MLERRVMADMHRVSQVARMCPVASHPGRDARYIRKGDEHVKYRKHHWNGN
jgi:hypothetical protein